MKKKTETKKTHPFYTELIQNLITDCKFGQLVLTNEAESEFLSFNFEREPFKPHWTTSLKEAMEHHGIKSKTTFYKKVKSGEIKHKPFGAHKFKYYLD